MKKLRGRGRGHWKAPSKINRLVCLLMRFSSGPNEMKFYPDLPSPSSARYVLDDLDTTSSSLERAICRLVKHGNDLGTSLPGPRGQTTTGIWSAQCLIAVAVQYATDFVIRYMLRPGNLHDSSKTPLAKDINSLLCGFGYGPRLGSIQE